jgi:hypothetical protein
MVHTTPEIATSNLILDFEFDQHLESHKHVISIIMRFRDTGCYIPPGKVHVRPFKTKGRCGAYRTCITYKQGGICFSIVSRDLIL